MPITACSVAKSTSIRPIRHRTVFTRRLASLKLGAHFWQTAPRRSDTSLCPFDAAPPPLCAGGAFAVPELSSNCDRLFRPPLESLAAMTSQNNEFDLELSRRKLLAAAGLGGGAVVAASMIGPGRAEAAVPSLPSSDPVKT